MEPYDSHAIETKWQAVWADARAFEVENPDLGRLDPEELRPRDAPVPLGDAARRALLVYTIGDVVTRFRARNGMRVLHPQGFDSFGLPAENAAIKEGVHPRTSTERNIEHITRSMQRAWAGRTTGRAR